MPEKLLTDAQVKNAKPKEKLYYLPDGGGLRLRVRTNGTKSWLLRYRNAGLENTSSLGSYPTISLSDARQKAAEYKKIALEGQNLTRYKSRLKKQIIKNERSTFGSVSREWINANKDTWSDSHLERNEGLLRRVLLKDFDKTPITEITEDDLILVLKRYYDSGKKESARRARQVASQIFSFSKKTHRTKNNPARDLVDSPFLKKPPVRHFKALNQSSVGSLMLALSEVGERQKLNPNTQYGLLLAMYTGLRDESLRGAKWSEIDFANRKWTIPAERMKKRQTFSVPLPAQAISVLKKLKRLSYEGADSYIFSSNTKKGYMAENTLRLGLHRLGFKVTFHGMRALITIVLNENEFPPDAVEKQLDHVERNKVRSAYLRTDFFKKRIEMMQWFADWCDQQKKMVERQKR